MKKAIGVKERWSRGATSSDFAECRLAFYTLFPDAMVIETVEGKIFDRFWIKGVGGQAPSEAAMNLLRRKLEGYLAQD